MESATQPSAPLPVHGAIHDDGSDRVNGAGRAPRIRPAGTRAAESMPMADLIHQASEQLSTLVRDELALARLEMTSKAKRAGTGAGLVGGAALLGLYGLFGVLAGAVLALALVVPAWAAALLVGGLLLVIAGVLALVGRRQFTRVGALVPVEAVDGAKQDVNAVKAAVGHRPPIGHRAALRARAAADHRGEH